METYIKESPQQAEHIEDIASKLNVLGHPVRLRILYILLHEGEKCVTDIQQRLSGEQSLISHHMVNMRNRKILTYRKEGKRIFYRIKDDTLPLIQGCLVSLDGIHL